MEKPFTLEQRDIISSKVPYCKTGICELWRAIAISRPLGLSQTLIDYIDQGVPSDSSDQVLFAQRLITHAGLLELKEGPEASLADIDRVLGKLLPYALAAECYDDSEQRKLSLRFGNQVKAFALRCEKARLAGKATKLEHTASMLWSGFREEVRDAYPAWYTVGPSYGPAAPKGILTAQSTALSECLRYLHSVLKGEQELTTEGLETLWIFNWYPAARAELLDNLFSIYEKENM